MLASWDSGTRHQPTFRIQGIRIISPRKSGQTDGEKRWWHLVARDTDPACSFPLVYGREEAVNNSFLTKKESKQRKKSKHKTDFQTPEPQDTSYSMMTTQNLVLEIFQNFILIMQTCCKHAS